MEVPFVSLGAGSSMAFPSGNQDFTFFVLREVQGSWVPYSFFFFFCIFCLFGAFLRRIILF